MTPIYGSVWSREYIDAHPLPIIRPDLLPWLIKDRAEAVEGGYMWDVKTSKQVHDGSGLQKAEQSLRAAKKALTETDDPKAVEFLKGQLHSAEGKAEFYAGKIYLLDKVIAATQAS